MYPQSFITFSGYKFNEESPRNTCAISLPRHSRQTHFAKVFGIYYFGQQTIVVEVTLLKQESPNLRRLCQDEIVVAYLCKIAHIQL
jgi:hypothetical protein